MKAEEFEIYKGKETFGRYDRSVGEYVFDGGVIVGRGREVAQLRVKRRPVVVRLHPGKPFGVR